MPGLDQHQFDASERFPRNPWLPPQKRAKIYTTTLQMLRTTVPEEDNRIVVHVNNYDHHHSTP